MVLLSNSQASAQHEHQSLISPFGGVVLSIYLDPDGQQNVQYTTW